MWDPQALQLATVYKRLPSHPKQLWATTVKAVPGPRGKHSLLTRALDAMFSMATSAQSPLGFFPGIFLAAAPGGPGEFPGKRPGKPPGFVRDFATQLKTTQRWALETSGILWNQGRRWGARRENPSRNPSQNPGRNMQNPRADQAELKGGSDHTYGWRQILPVASYFF